MTSNKPGILPNPKWVKALSSYKSTLRASKAHVDSMRRPDFRLMTILHPSTGWTSSFVCLRRFIIKGGVASTQPWGNTISRPLIPENPYKTSSIPICYCMKVFSRALFFSTYGSMRSFADHLRSIWASRPIHGSCTRAPRIAIRRCASTPGSPWSWTVHGRPWGPSAVLLSAKRSWRATRTGQPIRPRLVPCQRQWKCSWQVSRSWFEIQYATWICRRPLRVWITSRWTTGSRLGSWRDFGWGIWISGRDATWTREGSWALIEVLQGKGWWDVKQDCEGAPIVGSATYGNW